MKWIVALAVSAALAGCATLQAVDGGTNVVTNTVSVRVPVKCLDPSKVPELPKRTPIDDVHATTDQLAAAYAADVEIFEAYAKAADQLIRACVKTSTDTGAPNVTTRPLPR